MKLQYKKQKFQEDAAKAVVDVFRGQPRQSMSYMMDVGVEDTTLFDRDATGWGNKKIIPQLNDDVILKNIREVQINNALQQSSALEGRYNLTIEMETGVGKTYTYIKTMYELNKAYGWSKFIVVVPSVAIREGVYASFESTQEHFAEEYGKKIRYFIYNSSQLEQIDSFASDNNINVMIINSQAFNAKGKDARRIGMKLDSFRSRRPIDILAKTNPIMIIDEPQSVEGKQTKENLKKFNALFTLRYSATHRKDSIYNMVYRLDAVDAYQKRLVKKIAVKGITESGSSATTSYICLESVNISKDYPTATMEIDVKGKGSVRKQIFKFSERDNLFDKSNGMEEYKNNFVITRIDGRDNSVEFLNGEKIFVGDIVGSVDEDQLRRIQIRETIASHLEREQQLFYKGIKVLSLFFIDEVANYRVYEDGVQANGKYADIFEEEYNLALASLKAKGASQDYLNYLDSIDTADTHQGYFSIDKNKHMVNGKISKKEKTSDDVDAYDLIMKNKERLLDRDPKKSSVRFIFSHSALKEGWDNPNVFQICTLKDSTAEVRKRQEVGRGMRLCVNEDGDRMDANVLGNNVHDINVLTVIASESYGKFAKDLQTEIASDIGDRPSKVNEELFLGKIVVSEDGEQVPVDKNLSDSIEFSLIRDGYVTMERDLTSKYFDDAAKGHIDLATNVRTYEKSIIEILNSVYDPEVLKPENALSNNVEVKFNKEKFENKQFQELWKRINSKSVYRVDFDTDELIENAIAEINDKLHVPKAIFVTETGQMENIRNKQQLERGEAFGTASTKINEGTTEVNQSVKFDLVGDLVDETQLTRKAIVKILKGINDDKFNQFKNNPEEFILKAARYINDAKSNLITENIHYVELDEKYGEDVFTEHAAKANIFTNAISVENSIYDYVVYDSNIEKEFAQRLDKYEDVAVYAKLPNGFFVPTPVGNYNPDWAIAFKEGSVKHVYFVAETKGDDKTSSLRGTEKAKIKCAKKHFRTVGGESVTYEVVDGFDELRDVIRS